MTLSPLSKHGLIVGVVVIGSAVSALVDFFVNEQTVSENIVFLCTYGLALLSSPLMMFGIVKRKIFFIIPGILATAGSILYGPLYLILYSSAFEEWDFYYIMKIMPQCLATIILVVPPIIAIITEIRRETSSKRKHRS